MRQFRNLISYLAKTIFNVKHCTQEKSQHILTTTANWGWICMRQTDRLFQDIEYQCVLGKLPEEIAQITYDSRKVEPGALFVCIRGNRQDGHSFIEEAVRRGASVILTEKKGTDDRPRTGRNGQEKRAQMVPRKQDDVVQIAQKNEKIRNVWSLLTERNICVLETPDTREALAYLARQWFDHPQKELKIIGVTGTKGKTTTVWMIWKMLTAAGYESGLIGTIEVCFGSWQQESSHTTPESYELYEILRKMADYGCRYVVMEVSSQALKLHRVDGIMFDCAVFTNLRVDHIGPGEHTDFAEYRNCKRKLFERCRTGVFNRDDGYWQEMHRQGNCEAVTYGFGEQADYRAAMPQLLRGRNRLAVQYELIQNTADAPDSAEIHLSKEEKVVQKKREIIVNAPGKFSIYNSLAAIAVADRYQVPWEVMEKALHMIQVPGRIEMLPVSPRFITIVDYAHNAMALEALLMTLRDYHPGRIICIFGCGGNRSASRRFQMGEVAGRLADLVVVTTDNPREEDPEQIADDICVGLDRTKGRYGRIPDREEAIAYGISHAKPGDIVVITGKGHETYQEIHGKKYPLDDRELAMKCKVW